MPLQAALLIVAGALAALFAWTVVRIAHTMRALEEDGRHQRTLQLLSLLSPALAAAQADPRALLAWQPVAATARQLFPSEFEALDRAAGSRFPFGAEQIQAAHARWTADWLAWERAHDGEYKLKAAAAEAALPEGGRLARARLDAIEREKLESYQRRYEEYIRVGKALQSLPN